MTSTKSGSENHLIGSWKLTWPLAVGMLVPIIGSAFPLGFSSGSLNSPQRHIRNWTQTTLYQQYELVLEKEQEVTLWSVIISIWQVGAVISASQGSSIANKIGKRKAFLYNHLLFLLSSLLLVFCKTIGSVEMLIIGRLLSGLCSGFATSVVPLYLTEIAPEQIKGSINVLFEIGLTAGCGVSMITGSESLMGTQDLWSYHMSTFGVFVLISLALPIFLPESPTYCYMICKEEQAGLKALTALRGNKLAAEREGNIFSLYVSNTRNDCCESKPWTVLRLLKTPKLRLHFFLVILLFINYQLSGIGVMANYSNIIFTSSGLSQKHSEIANICAVTAGSITSVLSSFFILPRVRRKTLLLVSMSGCFLTLFSIVISLYNINRYNLSSYITIISLVLYYVSFHVGLGNMTFVIGAELMDAGPRDVALSLGPCAMWLSSLLVGLTFPPLQLATGEFSLFSHMAATVLVGAIFHKYLPETLTDICDTSENETISEKRRRSICYEHQYCQ